MKKGAIFDMDGTLFDTERLYAQSWAVTAETFGQVHNPDFPFAIAGSSGEEMTEIIHRYYPDVDPHLFEESNSSMKTGFSGPISLDRRGKC